MKLLATILMAMALSTSAFGGAGVPPTLPPPGLPYTVGVTPPVVASFTGILTSGAAPHTVCFTDQSTGTATAWAWTFGDGGTSTLRDPCHTYTVPGVYTVTLNVTCNEGSDDIVRTNYITVTGWPVVTSVSGTISHGSTVTLAGASFGTKATAAPSKWVDSNSRTPTTAVTTEHGWSQVYGNPTYETEAAHTGVGMKLPYTASVVSRLWLGGDWGDGVYLDYWTRFESHNETYNPRNFKQWRFYGSIPVSSGLPQANFLGMCTSSTVTFYTQKNLNDAYPHYTSADWNALKGGMSHWQVWLKQDKTGGTNASLLIMVNGQVVKQTNTAQTNDASTVGGYYNQFDFGYVSVYDEGYMGVKCPPDAYTSGTGYWYLDDFYMDNTQARVELGSANTYAASTHREIQIPTAWANGSIAITLNAGTIDPGPAWLYVTDSTGRTSAGKAVTIVAP